MTRREFTQSLLGTITSYALIDTLFTRDAFATPVQPITKQWLKSVHEMSADTKSGKISPLQWQERIKDLFDRVDLSDLLARIDFDKLTRDFEFPDIGVHTKPAPFPRLGDLPENLTHYSKVFGMKKDRAIIPHGHRNMVSCHLILKGKLHLRHYEKVEEDNTHMVIEPTIDEVARVGSHSSISDQKNYVHWLKALTDTAFTFVVLVLDLKGKPTEVDNIDPYDAQKTGQGLLRVRKLGVQEALKKYGHDTHH
jgi:hypothetical protein